jgi:uncharacterized membrane protein YdjX (TVP38/TMEM64 family)
MTHGAKAKIRGKNKPMLFIGMCLLILAALLIVVLFAQQVEEVNLLYSRYQELLSTLRNEVEYFVMDLEIIWKIMAVTLGIYALKAVFPILPLSIICFATAASLQPYQSIPLNILGLIIWVSLRYLWGKKRGFGISKHIINRKKAIRSYIERDGKGNPWLLFFLRLIPNFPMNAVSQIYGSLRFDYTDFVLISLLGLLPKIVVYTFIGRNMFTPLSSSFLVPLIIVCTLSGISIIAINVLLMNTEEKLSFSETTPVEQRKDFP